jgi:Rad3-related DNA helicase
MWSLVEDGKELKPLVFSNGKTQEDIVNEVLNAIREGEKIIFIRGACGTGKSAIALNVAKEMGRASIVVPLKNLQRQYESDYSFRKKIYKDLERQVELKIGMVTGRKNHPCQWIKENGVPDYIKKEKDRSLLEIFSGKKDDAEGGRKDQSAANGMIPCTIDIKESNSAKIKIYARENPNDKNNNISKMNRISIAPACLYWSPLMPNSLKANLDGDKISYPSISGEHVIYQRKKGCSYYSQFLSYKYADSIIFNSAQYLLETYLGRKPATNVEIIDECDEFLDQFASSGSINMNMLASDVNFIPALEREQQELLDDLRDLMFEARQEIDSKYKTDGSEIVKLKDTKMIKMLNFFLTNDIYKITDDDESYLEQVSEACRKFEGISDDTYAIFTKEKNELIVHLVSINLKRAFDILLNKNNAFVLMSGTIHDKSVLKGIFGIENFKVIEAETLQQGEVNIVKTGYEADFSYENVRSGRFTRAHYLKALQACVDNAKRPTLVHLTSFNDLPNMDEKEKYGLNLPTGDEIRNGQNDDSDGIIVNDFKEGRNDILYTTRCNRGVDFPGEQCNSVIISKFPYPHANGLFWRILKMQNPGLFWSVYKDKAGRDLLQKIYRSIRFKGDKVDLLSPDLRVLECDLFS